jgi:Fe-S-cluster-containing hydrogenase component 2
MRVDAEACIGCEICSVVCSLSHLAEINVKRSRIRVSVDEERKADLLVCRQCRQRACIKACPEEALSLAPTGVVEIDRERCTRCLECSEACPFGALPLEGGFPLFCDTCDGDYRCIQWCPTKVLSVSDEKE